VPSGKQQDRLPLSPIGHWVREWPSGDQEGGSSYYPHGIPGPSHEVRTSASAEFPHWYYPLERYINYGVDQAERTVEGIERIESRMDEFERVQTEIHASIDT
jgi:hypothetical protein